MKRRLLALLFFVGFVRASDTIAVDDAAIVAGLSPGSWARSGSTYIRSHYSGAYIKAGFTGTSLAVAIDVSAMSGIAAKQYPRVKYKVDSGAFTTTQLTSGTSSITIGTGLANTSHTFEFHVVATDAYIARWNQTMSVKVTSFTVDGGASMVAATLRPRKVMFFGDSVTESAWSLGPPNDLSDYVNYTDAQSSYARILADRLNAEFGQYGMGGTSWQTTFNSDVPPITTTWNLIASGVSRSFTGIDYIFVNLGTVDGLTSASTLTTWLGDVRAEVGVATKIYVIVPFGQSGVSNIISGYNTYIGNNPGDKTYLLDLGSNGSTIATNNSTDGVHLDPTGQTMEADELIALVEYHPPTKRYGIFGANTVQGIIGGIPSRSEGNTINVADYGWSNGNSAADNQTAFNNALADAVAGDVVSIPAGTFACAPWNLQNNAYSGITIRGAGQASTIIQFSTGTTILVYIGQPVDTSSFPPVSTVTSMVGGSNIITVSDGSSFPSPSTESQYRLGWLKLANEAVTPVMHVTAYPAIRKPVVRMIARSGNTITLERPLPSNFSDGASGATFGLTLQNPQHLWGVGIEDLTLDGTTHSDPQKMVWIENAANCWLKKVTITGAARYSLCITDSTGLEINRIDVRDGVTGILCVNSSYSLIYDNIILGQNSGYVLEMEQGAMSNIWADNYHGALAIDTNHGPHNSFNLVERNVANLIQSDGFFGGASEEIHLRNYWRSGNVGSFKRLARYFYPIGNIVGIPGDTYTDDGSDNWGTPNQGNNDYNGGTWQLSINDYSLDWNSGTGGPKTWAGTLTTRSTDYTGVITLSGGIVTDFTDALANHRDGDNFRDLTWLVSGDRVKAEIRVLFISGDDVTFEETGNALSLPATSTSVSLRPGAAGFQEKDDDVAATVTRKSNYYVWTGDIPVGESLGNATLPNSYAWGSKPSWYGNLAWPPFDPTSPPASDAAAKVAIPAGWRYINGNEDYLGGGGSAPTFTPRPLQLLRR